MKPADYLKFCKRYATVPLMPWQLEDLRGVAENRFSFLCYQSGTGKTTIFGGLGTAARLVLSKTKIQSYGGSGDEDQAKLMQAALETIFENPDLRRLVTVTANKIQLKHHPRSVHTTLATSPATSWGLTPSDLVIDELSEASGAM